MTKIAPYNVAVIFLHPACNMTCTFCITEDHFDAMTQDQAVGLLRLLKEEGFRSVVLGGGEPFQWPGDLLGLTREAKRLGFLVQIGTNAIALPEGFASVETIDRYVIPLESASSEVHNAMRFYKNRHHELIIGCLNRLRDAHKSVTLSTIITKINKDGLKSLAEFLMDLDRPRPFIHAWHLYKFIPEGRGGKSNADALMVSEQDYNNVCGQVLGMGLPFKVYRRKDMYRSRSVDFFWFEHGRLQRSSVRNSGKDNRKMTVPVI
jgi:MoaA/NifB/PqqE/SkfB family radical SAM enzyme